MAKKDCKRENRNSFKFSKEWSKKARTIRKKSLVLYINLIKITLNLFVLRTI